MNDTQNNKKRNNITQAQLSFVFAVLAILLVCGSSISPIQTSVGAFGFYMMFSMAAFILGLISLLSKRNQSSKIDKALAVFSIAIPVILFVWIFLLPHK